MIRAGKSSIKTSNQSAERRLAGFSCRELMSWTFFCLTVCKILLLTAVVESELFSRSFVHVAKMVNCSLKPSIIIIRFA